MSDSPDGGVWLVCWMPIDVRLAHGQGGAFRLMNEKVKCEIHWSEELAVKTARAIAQRGHTAFVGRAAAAYSPKVFSQDPRGHLFGWTEYR